MFLLKITRLVANPPGPDRAFDTKGRHLGKFINLKEEYVEIKNISLSSINLKDFTLTDATGKHRFVFPRVKIKGLSSLKIRTGSGKDTRSNLYWNKRKPVWNNVGDTAILKDANGIIIDKKKVKLKQETGIINISIKSVEKPDSTPWNQKYNITITFKNNKAPIDKFSATLFELETRESFQFLKSTRTGTNDLIVALYNDISKKDWKWFSDGKWDYKEQGRTQNMFTYKVEYRGWQGKVPSQLKRASVGKIVVEVSDDKLKAIELYNLMRTIEIVGIVVAIATGVIAAGATIALSLGLAVPFSAGIAIVVSGIICTIVLGWTASTKESALQIMNDPPVFDRQYKEVFKLTKLAKSKTRDKRLKYAYSLKDSILKYNAIQKGIVITRNRLWTATEKRDKIAAKKQKVAADKLLTNMKKEIEIAKENLKSIKQEFGKHLKISKEGFINLRKLLKKEGVPKGAMDFLIHVGFNKSEIKQFEKVITQMNEDIFKPSDLNLLNLFDKHIKIITAQRKHTELEFRNLFRKTRN